MTKDQSSLHYIYLAIVTFSFVAVIQALRGRGKQNSHSLCNNNRLLIHFEYQPPKQLVTRNMVVQKRCLLWDWTNTQDIPAAIDKVNLKGPMHAVSNWNAWTPPELKGRAPFRPMIHDINKLSGNDWGTIQNTRDSIIHFFNEPERAGITPQQAADIWHKQILPLRQKGNQLVSPSCASDPNGMKWIADFMNLVHDKPPDFLGLHWYGTSSAEFAKYLEDMHNKHPQLPVMVTEVASISRDYQEVLKFTVDAANHMDDTTWVREYGFFGCMRQVADSFVSPEAQLMKPDGSLTDLMVKLMNDQPMKA